jgi:hypothetical protein
VVRVSEFWHVRLASPASVKVRGSSGCLRAGRWRVSGRWAGLDCCDQLGERREGLRPGERGHLRPASRQWVHPVPLAKLQELCPSYGHAGKTAGHRTHQTIRGLSDRLGVEITAGFAEGQEPQLATAVLESGPGAALICWEHGRIPALASALPLVSGTVIPKSWPEDRYDVIWTFTLAAEARYAFGQVPQLLLSGDADTVIA